MKFFNFRFAKLGMAIAWAAGVASTQAYNVGDQVGGAFGPFVYQGSYLDTASAAVQNSTLVTERRVATVATEAQANMVLSQISGRLDSRSAPMGSSVSLLPTSGGNAGAGDNRSSVWARAGYDNLKEDNITSFGGWKANLWSLAIGYDYKLNDKTLVGAALTYSNINGSTAFNKGNLRDNAYGIVPYAAFKVAPCFDVDLLFGYSRVNKNRSRTTPGLASPAASLTGPQASSSPKADRYFAAIYANLKQHVNQWNLLARLGYLYLTDKQKSFRETNGQVIENAQVPNAASHSYAARQYGSQSTNVSRLSLRLQAGFKASQQVEPYAFLAYARDFGATKMKVQDTAAQNAAGITMISPNRQRSNDTYGGGLGLNACMAAGWNAGIEAAYYQSKKFKDIGGQLRIAKKF